MTFISKYLTFEKYEFFFNSPCSTNKQKWRGGKCASNTHIFQDNSLATELGSRKLQKHRSFSQLVASVFFGEHFGWGRLCPCPHQGRVEAGQEDCLAWAVREGKGEQTWPGWFTTPSRFASLPFPLCDSCTYQLEVTSNLPMNTGQVNQIFMRSATSLSLDWIFKFGILKIRRKRYGRNSSKLAFNCSLFLPCALWKRKICE